MEQNKIIAILFIAAVILGIIILIYVLIKHLKKINAKRFLLFQTLGSTHNLEHTVQKNFNAKLNILSGEINGHAVMIFEKMIGTGQHRTINTFIEFDPNPFEFIFTISKEHFFSKIGKKLGLKDIEFDDYELDRAFLFKSKDEEKFKRLFDYSIQSELTKIQHSISGSIQSNKKVFQYHLMLALTKQDHVNSLEEILLFMIKTIERSEKVKTK